MSVSWKLRSLHCCFASSQQGMLVYGSNSPSLSYTEMSLPQLENHRKHSLHNLEEICFWNGAVQTKGQTGFQRQSTLTLVHPALPVPLAALKQDVLFYLAFPFSLFQSLLLRLQPRRILMLQLQEGQLVSRLEEILILELPASILKYVNGPKISQSLMGYDKSKGIYVPWLFSLVRSSEDNIQMYSKPFSILKRESPFGRHPHFFNKHKVFLSFDLQH